MSTPEIIYLIPGEDIEGYPGMVWCESSAPSDHCDPDEAVKYVRADKYDYLAESEQRMISQMAGENERLQARVAELSKDAARYQYIRSHQYWQRHQATEIDVGWSLVGCKFDYLDDFQARPMLDHHIDKRLRNDADKAGGGV